MPGNMSVESLGASRKLYIESWHKDGRLHGNLVSYDLEPAVPVRMWIQKRFSSHFR